MKIQVLSAVKAIPVFLLLVSLTAFAQSTGASSQGDADKKVELLEPVDPAEIESVLANNDYFVKARTYFAKRHRFVRVNTDALLSDSLVSISLFPNVVVLAERTDLREVKDSLLHWIGRIVEPNYSFDALLESGLSEDEATEIWPSLAELTITGVAYDRDIATGMSFPSRNSRNAQGYLRPTDSSRIRRSDFYSFAANISSPAMSGTFFIRPLEATPEYHIVYEVDPSKEYDVGSASTDQVERRRKAHEDYLETIGEDPRIEWANRHQEQRQ